MSSALSRKFSEADFTEMPKDHSDEYGAVNHVLAPPVPTLWIGFGIPAFLAPWRCVETTLTTK
jgi:hypothetical protein